MPNAASNTSSIESTRTKRSESRVSELTTAGILRRTGQSVFLSPEGTRVRTGEIGPFNKGAFHLAGDLGAPLLPLYIAVPLPPSARHCKYSSTASGYCLFCS